MWKLPVLRMTIVMICTCSHPLLCCSMACLRGSYMVWMLFIVSNVLLSVEYLHSMSCKLLLPLYEVSSTRRPCEFLMYPMALIMSGFWCFGLLCFGSKFSGIMVGCFIVSLSFYRPSCAACNVCSVWSSCVVVVSSFVCALKSFTSLLPKSMLSIDHLPPLCVPMRSWRSFKVLLCLDVRSLAFYLHHPKMCVFVSGLLHFLQSIGP